MDATQRICDSTLESDEEDHEDESENKRGRPLAKLCILKNAHIPETEVPLFLGENVLGRDPNTCTVPLIAPSISKQHATICLSVYRKRGRHSEVDIEALVWDQGSMNGTCKGQMKLTPNVRYALSERDSLVVADIPCQYVSCAEDAVSSQGDVRTPVSRHSGVKATLLHATSTGGKKYVNGGTGARVSLPDQEDTMKTPGVTTVLSFEQTPTYPEGSLVPESDSDSDGERGERRRKAIVSDSDSHESSPRCSTFLSPTNKTVPESEDESPITPSSSTKNRPHRHVSFSLDETDMDAGRQQLNNKKTVEIVDDSAEEEQREEERTALGGTKSEESQQHVPVKTGSNVSLTGEDELPEFTPSVFTDPIPVFDMDSDTDVEGEEEEEEEEGVISACPATLTTTQQADQPPDTAQFHMDSDTDVDEDDDALDQVPKSLPSSADLNKPHVISVIQPEGVTMDSDTDVDDDAMSDAATNAKPPSLQSTQTADSAFSTQVENVHLDSDTDVDEDEEMKRGTNNKYPEIDETPTRLDIRPESIPAAPDSLQLDSDTDDEAIPAPALGEPSLVSSLTESWTTAQSGADLDFLSDSDTDVEEDSPLFIALVVSDVSVYPGTTSDDADPDVDESIVPRAGDAADLKEESDTDVEDAAESQIPSLQREISPWLLAPLQQNFSTPVPLTEGGLEDMDTQAFISPSAVPYRRAVAPAVRCLVLSASSGSQEDEDFVVAETQSFVLQTREREGNPPQDPGQAFSLESSGDERGEQSSREASFQFGLSDSKHLQGQALAMENTQAFVGGGVSVEDTLAYAAVSNADRTSLENDPHLEAKQAYGKEAEPARCSEMSAKESQVDSDLEDTQEFITMPNSDSEDDTDDDESRNTATADTQAFNVPTSSTLAMAETQLMPVSEEDESSDEENLFSAVLQVKREEGEEDGEADQPQKKHHSEALSVAETQPMHISEDEESDDEDLISGPRKRNAKPLQLDEEQTHTLSNSELSLETQPMATSGNEESDDEESDDEDLIAGPRKRKAKQLWLDEEQTQTLSNSELSLEAQPMHMGVSETQPMHTSEDEESDDEDSMPGPRKRKAKPLQLDEEETQTLSNSELSAVQTQPMDGNEEGESDEEETQPLASSDISAVETQPMVAGEDEEIDDEDSILGPRKRKAKPLQIQEEGTQLLTNSEGKEDQSERERKETEEQERLESEKTEREERERLEREAKERVEKEKEEQETLKCEKERIEKAEREETERLEKERIEREEMERLQRERIEREEMERLEKERIEREETERLERERIEREETERLEKGEKEKEEKEKLEVAKRELGERLERERIEQEHQAKLEREAKEKEEGDRLEKEKQEKEQQEKQEEQKKSKTPARSRRATRGTTAVPRSTEPEADSILTNDDVPARRTRSRSNSSNSVSSERSASSLSTQGGRGRGQGAKRGSSAPPPAASTRGTNRRRNTASTQQDTNDAPPPPPPPGTLSKSSKVSSCSVSSQSRGGRGGRQRGRGRKSEPIPAINIQSEQIVDPTPAARGRKSRRGEELPQEDETEKADPQQAPTTRGRRRANVSEPIAAEKQDNSSQECASGESPLPKRNVRGRAVKSETVEAPVAPAVSEGDQESRKGRKRHLEEANTEESSSSSHKVFKGKEKAQTPDLAGETKEEILVPAKRRGRASTAQTNKIAGVSSAKVEGSEKSETIEEVAVKKRGRGRPAVAQKKMKEEQEESGLSVDHVEASEPQTPTSAASRKRQAPADSSPVAKTPRSSSASPGGRLRYVSHAYKVLFTGVVDEEGERVLARLGGSMAKGVADMNCLVTDKVRRTVKFLCAVAKGIPIATTHWLDKSCKAGSFLSPDAFVVKDPEQEKKFSFCLQESLRIASSQPLLQGYQIHVTKSVKPEPVQMKDIIFCSGATLLPKMPSSPKPQTVVISCEEDLSLCGPALSASLPVVTAEFLLTGILQQRLDLQTHRLSAPAHSLQPARGRGRGRKKT
ncbi:hypothetical protein NQZ68_026074 [Dissostichus eleginoides]|nr:hypothetical protein NQZ68_026074 [Dissostichus eleginoides]